MAPYVVQSVRSAWVRDASDLAQWHMTSPVWVLLVYGLPAILICWLMAMKWGGEEPEDGVLQSWFLATALLPLIPAIPVAIHLFDGFTYCLGFLLVRKVSQDKLFQKYGARLRPVAYGWAPVSVAVLGPVYFQLYSDGKQADPLIGRPAVIARDERAMLDWMKQNLPRERVVLSPTDMAPWVATIPMISLGSHDVSSISYDAQRAAAAKFYAGMDVSVIDRYGVSYVVSEQRLASGYLLHEEGKLRVYEMPGHMPLPYAGSTGETRNGFRQWVFGLLGAMAK